MKLYSCKKSMLYLLMMVLTSAVFAQPLTGTYTIGGTLPDYPSINSAVGALTNNGISGAVIFNIRDGIYNEKITMYQFVGSSPANTVTFQSESGDSSLVIINDSSSTVAANNFTVQLFGADNIIFNKVTIQRPGINVYARVVEIGNSSNGISFLGNRIICGASSNTSINRVLIFTDSLNKNEDITIAGNLFQNGSYGIYKQSYTIENGNTIVNNIFENQTAGAVFVNWQAGINVSRNIISATGGASYRAIALDRSIESCTINKNKIAVNNGNAGLYFSNCNNITGNDNLASNNFIQLGGTSANRGISLVSNQQLKIYHNSINLTSTNSLASALAITGISTGIQLKNNVFVNHGAGLAINVSDTNALSISDYNDFYTVGISLALYNAISAPLLTDWIALSGMDTNSVSAEPVYLSATDLHASSVGINDKGDPLGAVSTDIDGEPRSGIAPDMGADEFTPLNDNITVKALLSPVDYSCGDSSTTVTIVVQNLGINNASAIPVSVDISGSGTLNLSDTIAGPISSYATDTFTFTGTFNTYAGGVYTLICYSTFPGDQKINDDTLSVTRTLLGFPVTPTVVSPQTFCEGDVAITALTDSGNVLFWYDQASGGNLIYTGNPFSPAITSDTTFYVEAHSGTGSSGCLRITEMGLDPDHIEIQNCSSAPVNVNGWVVAISDNYTNINLSNSILWQLSTIGTFAPGQIEYKTDGAINPWGSNILWNPGATTPGWAMIIDNNGNIVDFAVYGWADADIQAFNATINNFAITLGTNWNGSSMSPTCNTNNALCRQGNTDNDDQNDFSCIANSPGTLNPGLILPFSACGASACGSDRIQVEVIVIPLPFVNLGPDTVSAFPVTFDAGAGFSSYLWNTSATTQTIQVTSTGSYSIVVTDSNGCTATDSVNFISTVGMDDITALNDLSVYPNPVNDMLYISFSSLNKQAISIRLINNLGEILLTDQHKAFSGTYKKDFNLSSFAAGVYTLEIKTENGMVNRKCVVR